MKYLSHQELLIEGVDCLQQLNNINPKSSKLGAEVLYNFVCIGIESVLTAVLMEQNREIDHSGIFRMIKELEKIEKVDQEWLDCSKYMARFQSYCSLEPIPTKIPNNSELLRIMNFGKSVGQYAIPKIQITKMDLC